MSSLLRRLTLSPRQRHFKARALHAPIDPYFVFALSSSSSSSTHSAVNTPPVPCPRSSSTRRRRRPHDAMAATTPKDEDSEFGFSRPEMNSSKLSGTVDAYDRHIFLRFKSPEEWLPKVENSESDPLPKLLSSAIKARKNEIAAKTKVTICGGGEGLDGDVLVFPEMILYKGLTETTVDGFVDDVLVNGKPWASGIQEVLAGSHVFVCAHGSRDMRCGVCGPALIEKLIEEVDLRGLADQITVSPCSHIGGHKYAGNVIIYSPDADGNVTGHWYGYVTPDDVPALIDQHIGQGQVIERLWRGQMGAADEKTDNVEELKRPNGEHVKKPKKSQEVIVEAGEENVGGCCQGANGFSCCKDVSGENNTSSEEKKEAASKFSCWSSKWEQHNVLTAVAVVGAVATVAVAYAYYRRSH
ncbi:hypothetical protein MLD38_022691 [Melastoma candidum]|uniref:Uncharacterized protein n=1 Tax=Melastoma candidum TaxID=119954 RepID=A0ACB9QLX9_9MYRT|nr:hypothetical protein MLD38_022691 [Melastoma candidum]